MDPYVRERWQRRNDLDHFINNDQNIFPDLLLYLWIGQGVGSRIDGGVSLSNSGYFVVAIRKGDIVDVLVAGKDVEVAIRSQ